MRKQGKMEKNEENGELGLRMEVPLPKIPHPYFPQMGRGGVGMGKGLRSGGKD